MWSNFSTSRRNETVLLFFMKPGSVLTVSTKKTCEVKNIRDKTGNQASPLMYGNTKKISPRNEPQRRNSQKARV